MSSKRRIEGTLIFKIDRALEDFDTHEQASIAASATCATQNDVRVLKHLCHPVLREFVPCPEAGGMADAVIEVHEQAQTVVFEYIEVFYNRQRCHSANGYLAPLAYEQALKASGTLCPEMC